MNEGALNEFVDQAEQILARSPAMESKETELRIVLPFLKALGWEVHGTEVAPSLAVEASEETLTVDYALCLDGTPSVFVVTSGAASGLSPSDGERLTSAMTAANVPWGVATSGNDFVFVTHEGGEERTVACELDELLEEPAVLAHYTRSAAVERREQRAGAVRQQVADELATDRAVLVDGIAQTLTEHADDADAIGGELRTASEQFLESVLDALSAGEHPTTALDGDATTGGSTTRDGASGPTARTGGNATARDPQATDSTGTGDAQSTSDDPVAARETENGAAPGGNGDGTASTTGSDDGETTDDAGGSEESSENRPSRHDDLVSRSNDAESEYVVRFFNGRSSVGAVGHSTTGGAMAQAIEYMIEQHSLDSRLNLPWETDDGRALVNYEPEHADGSPMQSATQLSNGYYVNTGIGARISQAVVEELADNSGLRVMFRGDWS